MKRSFKILCFMLVAFMMTGCVKTHVNMDIKKDKSMDFGMIMAVNNSLLEQSNQKTLMTDEQLKEIKDEGFQVKDYSDGTMIGYTFTKNFADIDELSSENSVNFKLDDNITKEKSPKMFTVKKGFFKNTYTLKMENDTSNELQSGMEDDMTSTDIINDSTLNIENDQNITDNQNENSAIQDKAPEDNVESQNDLDLSVLTASMDMKFNITLPYKAISNNATSTENDGKKLTWNLLDSNLKNVQVEFELYNMNNIYLTVGIGITVILIIVIIIIIKKRKPKAPVGGPISVVDEPIINNTQNPTPVAPVTNIKQGQQINQINNMTNVNSVQPTPTNEPEIETLNIDPSNPNLNE